MFTKSNKKVLLVSNTPHAREVLAGLFKWFQFEIVIGHSGAHAVEIYTEDPSFDLVVLDIDMPGMNGFTAAKMIRQHQIAKRPYIIGRPTETAHSTKALQSGMDAYVISAPIEQATSQKQQHSLGSGS